ncbi:hypothetical protein JG687_00006010 [Phytophthora cactorum]|uniref:Uncharacterized protein n=1 Tax=Phytophthora cactorum TaxID=29920 RepID=A0A329S1S9_9STRA|nr:hypothetical protein Pcac1_g6615 [Phytophthora cactorum]KAG2824804.1 hypothetical protein PC111_g9680 [Phytophthora cactorum]KAG2825784.1 hypothetical protein PC112_g9545 [Phytophthora cactorum]KAG2860856.1 hypothetical protein PC113_g7695 [Phytophthora cactorum]KAG2904448.1 hypothetical protein PC114_g11867 [Phytophthora cactorum]
MAGRMDLEARLRALREGKRPPASPPAPPPPVATAASFSWPEVPSNLVKNEIPERQPVRVAVGGEYQPVRRASASFSAAPPVAIMSRSSSDDSAPSASFPTPVGPPKAAEPAPDQEEVLRLTATQLLGPDYEEAVKVAQYAIDNERRQMPHTAIDAYIRAGQMLIEIGRRQAAPHLQDIVKAKALALLQRAEGLSEWTNEVLAKDSSQQALAAAYHQSQQNCYRSLTEKQELVSKMQQDNRNMKARLNQLALLTKIRGRMMKVVKKRRARKAAEAEAAAQATRDIMSSRGGFNDVTGGMDDYEEAGGYEGPNNVTGSGSDEDEEPRDPPSQHYRGPLFPATHGSPREEQKVDLINELHNRIGLPQIDHLRKFEPLTSDPRADTKQEELQSELETAKQEADKLRAAVQEMEQCLRLAAQHSKQRSIKLEQQKAQEFAEVQSELDRVREELEVERRRSASLHSGPSSWRSSVASDPGTDESQDTGVMQNLRLSLHKVFRGRDEQPGGANGDHSRRASVQRTSYSHDSPRHTQTTKEQTYDVDEEGMEEDQDGGVWL